MVAIGDGSEQGVADCMGQRNGCTLANPFFFSQSSGVVGQTNSSPLKMDPWKRRFLLETTIFRGYVSFRECIHLRRYLGNLHRDQTAGWSFPNGGDLVREVSPKMPQNHSGLGIIG